MNDVVLTKADLPIIAQEATMEELSELQRIEDNIFRLLGFDGTLRLIAFVTGQYLHRESQRSCG